MAPFGDSVPQFAYCWKDRFFGKERWKLHQNQLILWVKRPTTLFVHNFGKCWPIFLFLSAFSSYIVLQIKFDLIWMCQLNERAQPPSQCLPFQTSQMGDTHVYFIRPVTVGCVSQLVECRSSAGVLSLSYARLAAEEWPLVWVNRLLQVSQLGQLSLSSFRGR